MSQDFMFNVSVTFDNAADANVTRHQLRKIMSGCNSNIKISDLHFVNDSRNVREEHQILHESCNDNR